MTYSQVNGLHVSDIIRHFMLNSLIVLLLNIMGNNLQYGSKWNYILLLHNKYLYNFQLLKNNTSQVIFVGERKKCSALSAHSNLGIK